MQNVGIETYWNAVRGAPRSIGKIGCIVVMPISPSCTAVFTYEGCKSD
jgi:hypothetical protein